MSHALGKGEIYAVAQQAGGANLKAQGSQELRQRGSKDSATSITTLGGMALPGTKQAIKEDLRVQNVAQTHDTIRRQHNLQDLGLHLH